MMELGHPGDMTAKTPDTREEMTGQIIGTGQTKSVLLIKTNQMPAIASVRRTMGLNGGKTVMARSNGVTKRSHGKTGRDTRLI